MRPATEQTLQPSAVPKACEQLVEAGGRLQMAYAWFPKPGEPAEVLYLANKGAHDPFSLLRCRLESETQQLQSLATRIPLLGWYEREMTDLCGISFDGHPEPRPLVLHEGAHPSLPPLDPRYPRNTIVPYTPESWDLPPIEGNDVQILPFGPVRGDVLESAQIVFFYIGEAILHCHPRLFFKHRGMEKRFEGLSPALGVLIAERVSGVDSVAHALAFCQAVEAAGQCEIPERARYLRSILAEMERLYNHLHYLGHLCHTTTLKVGEAIKRASGIARDLRCDHPYAAYDHLPVKISVRTEGDAHARVQVRMEEIQNSMDLILKAVEEAPEGPVATEISLPPGGEGLGWCEGVRGSIYYCVHFDPVGRMVRVKVKSASFSNWRVFPFTVHDTNMMDYAINEASFGLTMAGCDR